jgi:uncharacterized protein YbjQ (UPF0145 family)
MAKVTGLSGNEIYCLALKNYTAGELVVGNSVNSMGFLGGMAAGFKGMAGGEITQVTQAIEEGRLKAFDRMIAEAKQHVATGVTLDRIVAQAKSCTANAVVGIRTKIMFWHGTHEMLMTGTAARNGALPATADSTPVTSDLTGEELWALTSLGYAPVKLLISASIYSLGVVGGLKSAFKSFTKGEINDLTT